MYLVKDLSRMFKEHLQLTNKKTTQFKNRAENLHRHFPKEEVQMTNKPMKIYSTQLVIKEMKIKIIMSHHFTPIRMVIVKSHIMSVGEDEETLESLCIAGENIKCCTHHGKQSGSSTKVN